MPPLHPLLPPSASASTFFVASPAEHAHAFHAHPSVAVASKVTLQSAGVGLLVSSVQNALEKHDRGAAGVLTRTGGTIGFFAAMGFAFSLTHSVVANVRETDDALNGAAGGCAAGFVAGLRAKSLPMAVGSCAAMATLIGTFEATGSPQLPSPAELQLADEQQLTGTDRQALPRPEREERRLRFFKQPKEAAAAVEA